MLFFIGGAARTGKGILTRRLLAEARLPYLSVDVLKMGVVRAFPVLGIQPDAGALIVAHQIWPLVWEMSRSLLFDRVSYIFEGEILPQPLALLRDHNPTQVNACFIGYALIDPQQKLEQIRQNAGYPNDWSISYSDADLLSIIQREIGFSQYLQHACQSSNFPYFDTSQNFVATLDQVFQHIQSVFRQGETNV